MRRVIRPCSKSITFVVDTKSTRAPFARVFAWSFRETDSEFSETIMRKGTITEKRIPVFRQDRAQTARRSAAIRPLGGARCPNDRKDGRHPKFKDHGRIAGR